MTPMHHDPALWISGIIADLVEHSPENSLRDGSAEKAWGSPLTGFAAGDDPLFESYKEHVGLFHWTPLEAFKLAYPDIAVTADKLTVISWILPQTAATKESSRKESFHPGEHWARSRYYGEMFNETLRRQVVTELRNAGFHAVAPSLLPEWAWIDSQKYGVCSKWSERHAAYACGLGTFGLSDGLITPVGKAMRVGTVVARIKVPPTERPYKSHQEYCLYFTNGSCKKCVERCPVGSVKVEGRDKAKCLKHLKAMGKHVLTNYGFDCYGCGLCQTAVPCESRIPVAEAAKSAAPLKAAV